MSLLSTHTIKDLIQHSTTDLLLSLFYWALLYLSLSFYPCFCFPLLWVLLSSSLLHTGVPYTEERCRMYLQRLASPLWNMLSVLPCQLQRRWPGSRIFPRITVGKHSSKTRNPMYYSVLKLTGWIKVFFIATFVITTNTMCNYLVCYGC